jgi:hypothetical protein
MHKQTETPQVYIDMDKKCSSRVGLLFLLQCGFVTLSSLLSGLLPQNRKSRHVADQAKQKEEMGEKQGESIMLFNWKIKDGVVFLPVYVSG